MTHTNDSNEVIISVKVPNDFVPPKSDLLWELHAVAISARLLDPSTLRDEKGDFTYWRQRALDAEKRLEVFGKPIDMILYCPNCGKQHVDPKPSDLFLWKNPPHRSHLCHGCGCIWRPADVATNGVASIKTEGKADTWPVNAEEIEAAPVEPKRTVEFDACHFDGPAPAGYQDWHHWAGSHHRSGAKITALDYKLYAAPVEPKYAIDEWVNVEDSLPPNDDPVLVFTPNNKFLKYGIDQWMMQREAPLSFSSATIETGMYWCEHEFEEVTHWRPLLAPPSPQSESSDHD